MLKKRGEGEKREKREEEEKERGEERKEEKRGQLMNKMAFYACLSLSFLCFFCFSADMSQNQYQYVRGQVVVRYTNKWAFKPSNLWSFSFFAFALVHRPHG